jgi:hypothetical protein
VTSQRTVTCDCKKGRLICRDLAQPEKKLFVPERVVLNQIKAVFRTIQVPPKLLDALLAHMKAGHEAENQFHRDAIEGLRREYDLVRDRLAHFSICGSTRVLRGTNTTTKRAS